MSDLDTVPTTWGGDDTEPLEVQPDSQPQAGGSLADRVRAQHREAKSKHHLDLRVPGYDLVVRYRPIGGKLIEAITKRKADPEDGKTLTVAKDVLLTACERVYVYDPADDRAPKEGDDEGLVPFEQVFELGDLPVKLSDDRLAEALGYQADTARQIVGGLFPTDGAIIKQYAQVDVWMTDVTQEVAEELSPE